MNITQIDARGMYCVCMVRFHSLLSETSSFSERSPAFSRAPSAAAEKPSARSRGGQGRRGREGHDRHRGGSAAVRGLAQRAGIVELAPFAPSLRFHWQHSSTSRQNQRKFSQNFQSKVCPLSLCREQPECIYLRVKLARAGEKRVRHRAIRGKLDWVTGPETYASTRRLCSRISSLEHTHGSPS